MQFQGSELIFFSPTGTTRKVLHAIADGLASTNTSSLDLTTKQPRTLGSSLGDPNNIAIIGAPVYAGRIAETAVQRLKTIQGNNRPAILIAMYGNRHYDDALLELADIVKAQNFTVIAAATFIGEHSFSTKDTPLSLGRPDQNDIAAAIQFGKQVKAKLDAIDDLSQLATPSIPGNANYRDGMAPNDIAPTTNHALCGMCGICVEVCPVDAIKFDSFQIEMDKQACILCGACIRICPAKARSIDHPQIEELRQRISTNCSERREPEIFV